MYSFLTADDNYGFGHMSSSHPSSAAPSTVHHSGYPLPSSSSSSTTLVSEGTLTPSEHALYQQRMNGSKSVESLLVTTGPDSFGQNYPDGLGSSGEQIRCASVKSRPTAARRISAAELEHLMVRQCTSAASQFQPIPFDQVHIFFLAQYFRFFCKTISQQVFN